MSYVDAFYDREEDVIRVAERINGERLISEFPAEHIFYYAHPAGTTRSIFGDACKRFKAKNSRQFYGELKKHAAAGTKLFESDINPVFRFLANHYRGAEPPVLNVGFFDIEVAFDPDRGYAPTNDPFNEITAISLYRTADERLLTVALKPATYNQDDAEAIVAKFDDTFLFDDEVAMIDAFLCMIEDVDCLSGWNSESYDVPYLVNRIKLVMGATEATRLCLFGESPREREYIKFMRTFKTYELVGRTHLDYLLLYQKHNTQQQHSYRLDYIGEIEVGETKTPYEGTLDELYKQDFERFIAYSRQDTLLLMKIDQKRKFIELANQIAHANCVLLKTTMGTVSLVETAIINSMNAMGFVAPDRKKDLGSETGNEDAEDHTPVVGAFVAEPKKGIQEHVGCVDLNSLYPSTIRALNMSPETIVGQVRAEATMALVAERVANGTPRAEAWEGLFSTLEVEWMQKRTDNVVTVDFEDGSTWQMPARQLNDYVLNPSNNVCVSANGTLFRTDRDGIIPTLLAQWYAERKEMQKKARAYEDAMRGVAIDPALADDIRAILG